MENKQKLALLNGSLERTAEQLGDITPFVMKHFYARYPEAMERFNELYLGDREKLEGEMIEQALYCLMEWYECQAEVEIILSTTIPHHVEYLEVDPQFFSGLVDAVCETVVGTIPQQETGELDVWNELQATMASIMDNSFQYLKERKPSPHPA